MNVFHVGKPLGPFDKKVETNWKTITFYEKLKKEMTDLVRCLPSFSSFFEELDSTEKMKNQ